MSTHIVGLFELIPRDARREIIRVLVEDAGLSKSEVARLMNVTPSAVTRFLRGEAAPSPENLANLYYKLTAEEKLIVLNVVMSVAKQILSYLEYAVKEMSVNGDSLYARMLEASLDEILDTVTHILESLSGVQRGSIITKDIS